jgi:cytoskeletal protein CcmA (bactofilin family)
MSVFNRNDKMPETGTSGATPATPPPVRDKVETVPLPPVAEPKRTQATAQPIVPTSVSHMPMVSVISKALKITGQLESTEDIQIDGEIEGDVRAVSVRVGPNAKVKGAVYGDAVEVAGTVEGKIEAKKVVLTGTARMSGDVVHQDISIHSGAFIDGHCKPDFGKTGATKVVLQVHKTSAAE